MVWLIGKWLLAARRCVPTWRGPSNGSGSFAARRCQKPSALLIWSRSSPEKFRGRDPVLSLSRCHLTCGQTSSAPPRPAATPATRYAQATPHPRRGGGQVGEPSPRRTRLWTRGSARRSDESGWGGAGGAVATPSQARAWTAWSSRTRSARWAPPRHGPALPRPCNPVA